MINLFNWWLIISQFIAVLHDFIVVIFIFLFYFLKTVGERQPPLRNVTPIIYLAPSRAEWLVAVFFTEHI